MVPTLHRHLYRPIYKKQGSLNENMPYYRSYYLFTQTTPSRL